MLLVVTYSQAARTTLRNTCRSHDSQVVRRFGRAVLLEETELGALLALRLRARHGDNIQIERTRPLNEFREVPEYVRSAVKAYANRDHASTPYQKFAAGTDHPEPAVLRDREL